MTVASLRQVYTGHLQGCCIVPYLNHPAYILVNGIGNLSPLDTRFELHGQHSGVMTEPPVIGLVPCQSSAVNAGLLTCTYAQDLGKAFKRLVRTQVHKQK